MSATCCSTYESRVTRAEAGLARAARRAARTTTPSAHHLAAIAQAKADLAMVREGRAAHQAECETPRLLA